MRIVRSLALQPSRVRDVYDRLLAHRGPLSWWPGESAFEIAIGAILTQNTAWTNVEKALAQLRERGLLSFAALHSLSIAELAPLIRSAGYHNVKARRIRAFLEFLDREYGGRMASMRRDDLEVLRAKLLGVSGIGPETADCIVLYAAGLPTFVVDAYTRRIFSRLGMIRGDEPYDTLRERFEASLPRDAALFNEYHAQIVMLGKDACRKEPRCAACPLLGLCPRKGLRSVRGRRAD
jgi:endonuclease III related protein